jgi:hypothetical protein
MNTPKRARATIRWLSPLEGGRTAPPEGPRYVTVARFETSTADWQRDAWSLVVEFDQSPNAAGEHTALVWFLAYDRPETPHDLLCVGNKFDLLEGARVVAQGTIVEELGP